jgi:hypothetical protein
MCPQNDVLMTILIVLTSTLVVLRDHSGSLCYGSWILTIFVELVAVLDNAPSRFCSDCCYVGRRRDAFAVCCSNPFHCMVCEFPTTVHDVRIMKLISQTDNIVGVGPRSCNEDDTRNYLMKSVA